MNGTSLYQRTMTAADNDEDRDRGELMRMVWSSTPWMVDVCDDGIEREIRQFCNSKFGRESSPIHRQAGVWRRGNVTMHWKTWYGFATKEIMEAFVQLFGGCGQ